MLPRRPCPLLALLLLLPLALACQPGPPAQAAADDAASRAQQAGPLEITFLDVGQGDAVLLRAPEGQTALVDAGPGGDVVDQLRALGVTSLDLVVASHPHADHIGGMTRVLESFPVRFYMDNGEPYTTATYARVMRTLQARPEITYLEATRRSLQLGSARIQVLPIPLDDPNPNNHSVALVVEHGEFRAFLSGDSEAPELESFARAGVVPSLTLMKAPHHGSDDAVSEAFLRMASPRVVVISVGWGNTYGHPSPAAMAMYPRYAGQIFRTDQHGQVAVAGYPDGSYEVTLGGR